MNGSVIGFVVAGGVLFTSFLLDLVLCPYSKVEESFPLQATHDIFYHGVGPAINASFYGDTVDLPYDHLQYPGVVPRTFAGPIILAYLCRILLLPCSMLGISVNPMTVQFLARFILLSFNWIGWIRLALAVDRTVGKQPFALVTTGSYLLLITACQFHIPFYASRMLPNTFALAVVLQCYANWIQRQVPSAAVLLVFATAVFRCDLLLLLASLGLSWLIQRQLTIVQALKIGIVTGVAALVLTVPTDSILWQRLLWPEGEVFYFNTILGKSQEWGTSPWYWYFLSAVPKAMLLTILLVPLSTVRVMEILVAWERKIWRPNRSRDGNPNDHDSMTQLLSFSNVVDGTWLPFLLPTLSFVALYSFLGHKEIRFIFPAIPILNLCAAAGMSRLHRLVFSPFHGKERDDPTATSKTSSWIAVFGFLVGIACMCFSLCGSLAFVAVSRLNYPGGIALTELLHHIVDVQPFSNTKPATISVHIDVAAAMSGVSLFGQREARESTAPTIQWEFFKDGYEMHRSVENWSKFSHLLTENPTKMADLGFHVIRKIPGKPRLSFRERRIVTKDVIFVMEKDGWIEDENSPYTP
ncbi:Alg9-like mannosyltransferase family-domain containing protein [Nitzschia inconspicua]|uniref:Mannosyltransferase n=1 Tax=Nitzschia inconspicua TaxID=303405 RepID=A0A9K3KSE5_9STRA|nr:Alg9-like mannosyltransferase family-domain containing protein [Nitzschia inconspicua]